MPEWLKCLLVLDALGAFNVWQCLIVKFFKPSGCIELNVFCKETNFINVQLGAKEVEQKTFGKNGGSGAESAINSPAVVLVLGLETSSPETESAPETDGGAPDYPAMPT